MNRSAPLAARARNVQFTHTWTSTVDIDTYSSQEREAKEFVTSHRFACYKWDIEIQRGNDDLRGGCDVEDPVKLKLTGWSNPDDFNARNPVASECIFHLDVIDSFTNMSVMEARELVVPTCNDGVVTFIVPLMSTFGRKLNRIYSENSRFIGYTTKITSTIIMPPSAFETEVLKKLPKMTNSLPSFLKSVIIDRSRCDFTIRCKNREQLRTNRESLYISSTYFRNGFDRRGIDDNVYSAQEYSLAAVKMVIIFLTTRSITAPTNWTPKIAVECVVLWHKYRLDGDMEFYDCLENLVSKSMSSKSVDEVVKFMIIGFDYNFCSIKNISISLLLTKFEAQFREYYEGSDVTEHRGYTELYQQQS